MAERQNNLEKALAMIRSTRLQHPDDQILECFLQDSADPEATARYTLQRCTDGREDYDLIPVLSEWKKLVGSVIEQLSQQANPSESIVADVSKRDGFRCCITGLKASIMDPLVVVPIFPAIGLHDSLHDLLGVFIGSDIQERLLNGTSTHGDARNHWLVRRSAAEAVSQGYFRFTPTKDSNYRVTQVMIGGPNRPPLLDTIPQIQRSSFRDHSNSGIDTPDISLLLVISRFSRSIRWTLVAREIASRHQFPATSLLSFSFWDRMSEYGALALVSVCRLMPISLRIRIYHFLRSLGSRIYGSSCSLRVQQLPFGMYLKTKNIEDHRALENEFGALQLIRSQTQIPVPRPLDLLSDTEASYLLTATLPGQRLGSYMDILSDHDLEIFASDIQRHLTQLRSISRHETLKHEVSNAIGGPCYDYRIIAVHNYDKERGDFFGPFTIEEDFNNILRTPALPDVSHFTGHEVVFTHSDINMRNILIHNGRISGIVDWENSGWFPEYWEHAKAHYVTKLNQRWLAMVDQVLETFGDFRNDLAIERRLWEYCF